jgi:hypothetical protein
MNKNMFQRLLIISVCSLAIWSCTPKVQSGSSQGDYYEDLSAYRPTYPSADTSTIDIPIDDKQLANIVPEYHINDTLNSVLDSISVLSQGIRYINGYTVQIYSGNSREAANIASGKAHTILEDIQNAWRPKVSYKAPNFKVQVGKFYNTLDSHAVRAKLLREFPNAIIVLKKFRIKRN